MRTTTTTDRGAAPQSWRAGAHPSVLRELRHDGVNVVSWKRQRDAAVEEALVQQTRSSWGGASHRSRLLGASGEAVLGGAVPNLRAASSRIAPKFASRCPTPPTNFGLSVLADWAGRAPSEIAGSIDLHVDGLERAVASLPDPAKTVVWTDALRFTALLSELYPTASLRLTLDVVHDVQCPKFHVDHVHARLVTTYLGPGTEWVPDDAVDRDAMRRPVECPHEANRAIVPDARAVVRARTGDVVAMKGAAGGAGLGAVHRSPAISAGSSRVLLVVTAMVAAPERLALLARPHGS